jgi:hypothetical protein
MRIEILRDAKGAILATSRSALPGEVPVAAEVEAGHDLTEIDVPDRYMMMPAMDLIRQLQVEIRKTGGKAKARKK